MRISDWSSDVCSSDLLQDFDVASDAVALEDMIEIDRYALAMTSAMQAEVLANVMRYEFHPAVSRLQIFCSEDLGAFYLDVLKEIGRASCRESGCQYV